MLSTVHGSETTAVACFAWLLRPNGFALSKSKGKTEKQKYPTQCRDP